MSFEIKGKYNKATVLSKEIDEATAKQINELVNDPISKSAKRIVIQPDCHAGAGNVIGLTMELVSPKHPDFAIAPDLIGSDGGCGMLYINQPEITKETITQEFADTFRDKFNNIKIDFNYKFKLKELKLITKYKVNEQQLLSVASRDFGTLGGGNHFIEFYERGILIHSGSRGLGGLVFKHYKKLAKKDDIFKQKKELIERLKAEGRERDIQLEINLFEKEALKNKSKFTLLRGELAQDYLEDMKLINLYAAENRKAIHTKIGIILTFVFNNNYIDKPHNFIRTYDTGTTILRKGAQAIGENLIIPINMRDGFIHVWNCWGVDEEISKKVNYSAPHGAGRRLSRTQARNILNMDTFSEQMNNIASDSVRPETLDEAPDAYKPIDEILAALKEYGWINSMTREYKIHKPIFNFKEIETKTGYNKGKKVTLEKLLEIEDL